MVIDPFEREITLIDLLNFIAPSTLSCSDTIMDVKSTLKNGRKLYQTLLNDIDLSLHGLSKDELLSYSYTEIGDKLYNKLRVEIKKQIETFDILHDYVENSTDVLCSEGLDSIPEEIRSIYLKGTSWRNEVIKKVYEIVPNGLSRNTLLISAGLMSPYTPLNTSNFAAWARDFFIANELYDQRPQTYPTPVNPTPREEDLGTFLSMRIDDTPQETVLNAEKDLQEAEYRKTQWSFGLEDPTLSMAIALTVKDTEQEAMVIIEEAKKRIDEYDILLDRMRKRVEELREELLPGGGGGKSKRSKSKRSKSKSSKSKSSKSKRSKSKRSKSKSSKSKRSKSKRKSKSKYIIF